MLIDYLSIKSQHGKRSLYQEPIHLEITFTFQAPQSYSPKKQSMLLNKPHQARPDLDNLVKYVMDICTGALYTDDKIVTSISAEKIYGLHPKTIFTVTKL
jgi:Holliday junction resolvase RusA-like endonuclease